ncbi:MAG: hypothetical protein KGI63_11780, partial [Xanthomonadaceae bacterium]|nr:hypothetical protein [Xanthomonadaceae bacterium]
IVGVLMIIPSLLRLFRQRQYAGVLLAMLGTPLVTLLAAGVIFALLSSRVPSWQLVGMGAAGQY